MMRTKLQITNLSEIKTNPLEIETALSEIETAARMKSKFCLKK